jgi:LDH2 family malate/lactate/ureidoglycolate dehydrogenase
VDYLLDACRAAAPDDPADPVRVPGERAWLRRQRALMDGVELYAGVMDGLTRWAARLGVEVPRAGTRFMRT